MTTTPAEAAKPEFVQLYHEDREALRAELAAGLLCPQPAIAPKFLYDTLGSRLFEAITELDEYYPTRTEAAIMASHREQIARAAGSGHTLVDLGAGNCAKAAALFDALRPQRYVAVDISVEFLRAALGELQHRHPALPMVGVGQDFSQRLHLPAAAGNGSRLMFYPGSSIGNFTPEQAATFLRQLRIESMAGGALLLGVDLVKPVAVLEAAYDDALGVTGAFNLNLLRNVNRVLGSDFDVAQWRHVALFNGAESRIEMHVEARCDVCVRWPGGQREWRPGQRLHTENSCKYTVEGFDALLRSAGFGDVRCWTDDKAWFAVFLAR
ncbi:MAG: L-histidine N(alpha)-methyltransferase [Rubrivivax sp.]